jgi:hypothetical protein
MNTQFSTTATATVCSGYRSSNTTELSLRSESPVSIAAIYYENMVLDHSLAQQEQDLEPLPAYAYTLPPFYPVDESMDLSLKELLTLSDDYLCDHEEENSMSNSSPMLNPIPLNVLPCDYIDHNVAASDAASQAYTEHGIPMHKGNQMQPTMDHTELTLTNEGNVRTIPSTSCQSPVKKRRRGEESRDDESDEAVNDDGRFRPYLVGLWAVRFNDLRLYREKQGNCLVPWAYKENLPLARWVKRQRFQYKLMVEGKSSAMTDERVKALEEIGFVWDTYRAAWEERLDELKEFRSICMHCCVPSNYSGNQQLASWVTCQRRMYKLHIEGKFSNMTPQRIRDLEAVGFEWLLRSPKKQHRM